jgi:toxin ParE1/3/4
MKTKVLWRPRAREDLLEIYVAIGLDNPSAAERMLVTLEERVRQLEKVPRSGMRRPEIAKATRVLVEGVYLILYETHPDTDDGPMEAVEIVRIVHGHRDLSRMF